MFRFKGRVEEKRLLREAFLVTEGAANERLALAVQDHEEGNRTVGSCDGVYQHRTGQAGVIQLLWSQEAMPAHNCWA